MSSKTAADRIVAVAILAASLVAFPARGERTEAEAKIAQSLFDEARALMKNARYAEACPKLAESQRLDPALGTLLNLALCHRLEGRLATAWAEFQDALAIARQQQRADREAYASKQLTEIEPHLSYVTITLTGTPEAGLEVRLDGTPLGAAAFGVAMKVDPGPHRVDARAPGKTPWSLDVEIGGDADKKAVAVPALRPVAAAAPSRDETRRTIGWLAGGAGVAALGVGALAGLQATSQWGHRNDSCVGDVCSAAGLGADRSARRWAAVSDIALVLGAVGVGVGTYFVLTSGARVEARANVASSGAGVSLGAAW